ncbi:MAG: hypothetical protein U1F76_06225 [Candidatus Competibacteraceae bacterium]
MNYYKLIYTVNEKNERVYPKNFAKVVCKITQDHFAEKVMIAGTDSNIVADKKTIIKLTEDEALALIEEFKQSYPKLPHEEFPFPPRRP